MANRKEVAEAAGVSTATVTRVTSGRGYVSPDARERVERAIRELEYRSNQLARNLRLGESNVIAVLAEDIVNPYYSECIEAMISEARIHGYVVSLFVLTDRNLDAMLDEIMKNSFAGVVNTTLVPLTDRHKEKLQKMNVRTTNVITEERLITMDYYKAMRKAYREFQKKGRKRIAFLSGVPFSFAAQDGRLQSYFKLNAEFGMESDARLIVDGDYPEHKYYDLGYSSAKKLLDKGVSFDAAVCLTDIMATGVYLALAEHGLSVPKDVSVLGCDNIGLSATLCPALTTMDTFGAEISRVYIRNIVCGDQSLPRNIVAEYVPRDSI